jgi:REP element-mobilizing transposase RayT
LISGEHVLKSNERVLKPGEHKGSPLHRILQWFKTMTTNEYIHGVKQHHWPPFNGKLWQRNYYEHIIRDELSFEAISSYIIQNPANWKPDKHFKK